MADVSESSAKVSSDGDSYALQRNLAASAHLNFMFFLWKDALGFNVHPRIPLTHENACIAEIATGSAMWLIDVAREQPRAQLHGFDISLEQAPCKERLPANVVLTTWNVFDDIPEGTAGKFDMIHLRLLRLAVKDGNTKPILRNVAKMLKPGGHLQWEELDEEHTTVQTIDLSGKAPAWNELTRHSKETVKDNWPLRLDQAATEVGFEDSRLYQFEDRKDMSRLHTEVAMLFFEEFASRLETTDSRKEEALIYRNLLRAAASEIQQGSIISIPKVMCVARKPPENATSVMGPDWKVQNIPPMKPAVRDLYRTWSNLEGDALAAHLYKIRELALKIAPYPCLGRFGFVSPNIAAHGAYRSVVEKAQSKGATILDVGCCLGQNLRMLATEGVPTENMHATDLKSELWELGFELFGDRDKMKAIFVEADLLHLDADSKLHQLRGKIDVIIACLFLHLFDWDKQAMAIKSFVELSRLGTMVAGRSRGSKRALIFQRPWGNSFVHDVNTFKEIWRLVGIETGTAWAVDVVLVELQDSSTLDGGADQHYFIDFAVTREQ